MTSRLPQQQQQQQQQQLHNSSKPYSFNLRQINLPAHFRNAYVGNFQICLFDYFDYGQGNSDPVVLNFVSNDINWIRCEFFLQIVNFILKLPTDDDLNNDNCAKLLAHKIHQLLLQTILIDSTLSSDRFYALWQLVLLTSRQNLSQILRNFCAMSYRDTRSDWDHFLLAAEQVGSVTYFLEYDDPSNSLIRLNVRSQEARRILETCKRPNPNNACSGSKSSYSSVVRHRSRSNRRQSPLRPTASNHLPMRGGNDSPCSNETSTKKRELPPSDSCSDHSHPQPCSSGSKRLIVSQAGPDPTTPQPTSSKFSRHQSTSSSSSSKSGSCDSNPKFAKQTMAELTALVNSIKAQVVPISASMTAFDKVLTNVSGALNSLNESVSTLTEKLTTFETSVSQVTALINQPQSHSESEVLLNIQQTINKVSSSTDLLTQRLEGLSVSTLIVHDGLSDLNNLSANPLVVHPNCDGDNSESAQLESCSDSITVDADEL